MMRPGRVDSPRPTLPASPAGAVAARERNSGRTLGVDIPAKREALGADGRIIGQLAGRVVDRGREACHLMPVPAAEAASWSDRILRNRLHGAECRLGGATGGDDLVGQIDAGLADADAWPRNELAGLALRSPAERAAQLGRRPAAVPPPAGAARRLDNLVDALVAEPQSAGQFAQRSTAEMKAAYRPVELGAGDLSSVFRLDEPLLGPPGKRQQFLVHDCLA
jgi:hypothetical protein